MWPKYIAQIVVAGATAVGRALNRAVREELLAGRQAASRQGDKTGGGGGSAENTAQTRKRTASNLRHSMTLQEALQILHTTEPLKVEEIQKRFEHLHACNDKQKGGSFYLQEKIKSAKERIDDEFKLRAPPSSSSSPPPSPSEASGEKQPPSSQDR